MRIQLMKNINCDEFDSGPEDPELVYNSCEDCFFRLSTINRFAKDVQKLRGGRL